MDLDYSFDKSKALNRPVFGKKEMKHSGPGYVLVACTLSLIILYLWSSVASFTNLVFPQLGHIDEPNTFRWPDIVPSFKLEYHDCYDGLQCARLEVPLDYNRTDGKGLKVAIAVTRLPARVPVSDCRYGGAVLVNPGGPGASGIAYVINTGKYIQKIVDAEGHPTHAASCSLEQGAKYFDIIGFDPRGVNNTTPTITCWPDSFSRQVWNLQTEADGILGSSNTSFELLWQRAKTLAEGCSQAMLEPLRGSHGEALGEHVNTTPVVEDMLRIVEAHETWRDGHMNQDNLHRLTHEKRDSTVDLLHTKKTPPAKLQFWGTSYGTLLGSTFAAMYPNRIHRMVLDGVVNADDYYNTGGRGTWNTNLLDADAILSRFFEYCNDAGASRCSFYRNGGIRAIHQEYERILASLRKSPLPVQSSTTHGPELVSWSDVKKLNFPLLYQPVEFSTIMARLLQGLSARNGSAMAEYKQDSRQCAGCKTQECESSTPYSKECAGPGWDMADAAPAILCTDGEGMTEFDRDEFIQHWSASNNQSAAMGDLWAQTRLNCVGWRARAKWRFDKPIAANRTSHPILFVSNSKDPVCPMAAAQIMSKRFNGSVVLEQLAEGHCSFAAPSICTAKTIRNYFQTGMLPAAGTACEVDIKPFVDPARVLLSQTDSNGFELLDGLLRISRELYKYLR